FAEGLYAAADEYGQLGSNPAPCAGHQIWLLTVRKRKRAEITPLATSIASGRKGADRGIRGALICPARPVRSGTNTSCPRPDPVPCRLPPHSGSSPDPK